MNGSRGGLPGQASPLAVQLELVGELLGLLGRANELHDGEELLIVVVLLLLLEHEHEVVAEARLHHDPVDGTGQRDVRGQEDDVLALQSRDALVLQNEMRHDLVERALPLARLARARTIVWSKFFLQQQKQQLNKKYINIHRHMQLFQTLTTMILVVVLLLVGHGLDTSVDRVLARKLERVGELLHAQIAYVAERIATRRTARELGSTIRADDVTRVALHYWRHGEIEADGALEQVE